MNNAQNIVANEHHVEHMEVPVSGMSCGGCAATVQQALEALTGVVAAKVSHAEAKAQIDFDPASVSVPQLLESILKAGYEPGVPLAKASSGCHGETGKPCCCSKK